MSVSPKMPLFFYQAPAGIECCVCAKSHNQAAKALCTTGNTLKARGQTFNSPSDASPSIAKGLKLAAKLPGTIYVRDGEQAEWKQLEGDPAAVLLTDKQRRMKTLNNALISAEPMKQRSITCDDETWAKFLELGGSNWFRKTVKATHARQGKKSVKEHQ